MPFIEAATTFYLGRRYDPTSRRLTDDVVYYDSRDLTTHAVVVGMTGSGKTGLCIDILEEAILDGIPAIVIDPKGDITNLMLAFPDLRPEDFEPWINVDDARRAGLEVPAYAADIAHRWREGLGSWGIAPERLRWFRQSAQFSIYTPGSDAGLPVSILASLRAPREGWEGHQEVLREKISGIVTALLSLVGRDSRPVQDRDHVLVSNIFEYAWQRGQDLTLEEIILQVQKPPFNKLGVFPLDDYIAEKERIKLAMELNNIVAAPSYRAWLAGDPMDVHHLLFQPDGRPRVSIFYIAHLSERERQFVMTLLLENVLSWMRTQSGTTSLRALLYIDEMFGYFPPYPRNPPTKEPLLRLLKQARAFGVGMILATQNPGDLDYKGLTNAGTWFIGRLQAENDKARVMSGLQTLATTENHLQIKDIDRLISDIPPRVFLMHNVNEAGPIMVHTRWAMSYLRGPLTRQQVQTLMTEQRARLNRSAYQPGAVPAQVALTGRFAPPSADPAAPPPPPSLPELPPDLPEFGAETGATAPQDTGYNAFNTEPVSTPRAGNNTQIPREFSDRQPPVPSTTPQYFLPTALTSEQAIQDWQQRTQVAALGYTNATLAYRPMLLAQATVRYQDRKAQVYTARVFAYHVPALERAGIVHWDDHKAAPIDPRRVSGEPLQQGLFGDLPSGLTDSKRLTALRRELADMLYTVGHLTIMHNPTLGLYADPDGEFSEFRARVQQAAREQRDAEVDNATRKAESVMDKLEANQRRKMQRLEAEQRELAERKREEMFTTGEAVIGLLRGRTAYTLSRMSRAAVYSKQSKNDISQHQLGLEEIARDMAQAEQDYEAALREINERWARVAAQFEPYVITPYKKDITVDLFGIGWAPYWYAVINQQPVLLPAHTG
jgi:hypothetical protein